MKTSQKWTDEEWKNLDALVQRYKNPEGINLEWKRIAAENPPEWQALVATGRSVKNIKSGYSNKYRKPHWKSTGRTTTYKPRRVKATVIEESAPTNHAQPDRQSGRSAKFCPECGCNLQVVNAALNL